MPAFLKAVGPGVLTAATFHMYGRCAHDPAPHSPYFPPISAPGFALQPICLSAGVAEGGVAANVAAVKENASPGTLAIIGESALTGGGGVDATTNAFVSSMWYADWLAFAAKSGVSAVFRETLVGGYYELVNKTTYLPNPDAFTVALFTRMMGPTVLSATVNISAATGAVLPPNSTQMLRCYAHCSRRETGGGATVLLINLGSEVSFSVSLPAPASGADVGGSVQPPPPQLEWHLTPWQGDIHSKVVELNGEVLHLTKNNTEMPPMEGRAGATSGTVAVGPKSVVFVQLAGDWSPTACKADP